MQDDMKVRRIENRSYRVSLSRDTGIVVGVSVVLSIVALIAFTATLPV